MTFAPIIGKFDLRNGAGVLIMKLSTRLTLYLSLTIVLIFSGYGYLHILSRRNILTQVMKTEVRSIAEILRFSLEKISLPREMAYVQELLDAVSEPKRTLGVVFYYQERDLIFRSQSFAGEEGAFWDVLKNSIREEGVREEFEVYQQVPVYSYSFSLKDKKGKRIGRVSVVQHTSFLEEDIAETKRTIFLTVLALIGGTVILILIITRRWLALPIAQLMGGIQRMAGGQLDTRIDLPRGDEISELAQAFNRMASDLNEARQKLIRENETTLELERSLRQSEKLAAIGQLASELAHEMGTPLNIISGRAELTKRRLEDKESAARNLDIIAQQTGKIIRTIQQLLGFVRKKRPEQRILDIHPVLESTLDFLGQKVEKQGVQVVRDFMDHPPPVKGDADQLQQVFLNLVLNALQAMPAGGTLRLSTSSRERVSRGGHKDDRRSFLEVSVQDTGVGMEGEVMEKIFTPFFTTKEGERGTGLGLTVAQGIILEHGGWIEAESQAGKGSLFKIYLPSAESSQEGPEEIPPGERGGT